MNNKYDLIIVGAGPSSIFLAYELIELKVNKNILIIEQGKKVEERVCPAEGSKCVKCKPLCHITSGFSGAEHFQMVNFHCIIKKMRTLKLVVHYTNILV